jgi:serine/threonine-protein phosphatase PGAM5
VSTTTIHLVRHGEADASGENPGLTDVGRHQAERAGARLADAGAVVVLHSSRRRACETGVLVADALGVTPEHSPYAEDLTPIPLDWSVVPERYHEFLRNVPDVERDLDGVRLDAAFDSLTAIGGSDRTVVVVTHNFVIGWFVRRTLEAPWWRWIGLNQANGAITTLTRLDGHEPRLVRFNDAGIL